MRVLLVSGEFPPMVGGVGDFTACLAKTLQGLGVEVSVLTSAGSAPSRGEFPFPVSPRVRHWGFGSWSTVREEVLRGSPDIVHIQYQAAAYGLHAAINLLPAWMRIIGMKARPFVTFHDLRVPYLFPKAGALRGWVVRLMARSCRGVICTDEADLETVSRWGLRFPARLIPIGSNIPVVETGRRPVSTGDACSENGLALGYFGLLNQSKGVEVLLRAYRLLRQRGLGLTLSMIGADLGQSDPTNIVYSRRIRGISGELDIDGSTHWTGRLSPAGISRALQGIDVCILPYLDGASFRRGTLMAALAHGLPVITTTPSYQPARGPSLSDGDNCRLVPPGDVGALAEAIEVLANSAPLREKLAAGALELSRHFSWGEIARQNLAAYQGALSGAR